MSAGARVDFKNLLRRIWAEDGDPFDPSNGAITFEIGNDGKIRRQTVRPIERTTREPI